MYLALCLLLVNRVSVEGVQGMIQIEVQNKAVRTRTIRAQKGDFQIHEQEAWAFLFDAEGRRDPYPTRITLRLEEGQSGYALGTYYLAPPIGLCEGSFRQLSLGPSCAHDRG